MLNLLKNKAYNAGSRPSEHVIGKKSFLVNNGGSIMHNLVELEQIDPKRDVRLPQNVFSMANTVSNDYFLNVCREKEITPHPARMPLSLASLFVEFLTDRGDLVLDPFAGTNTTGYSAEKIGRRWVSVEIDKKYGEQAAIRFKDPALKKKSKNKK
jgi:site-specific DNA-methyltransferase (cytosine-N4-specific)